MGRTAMPVVPAFVLMTVTLTDGRCSRRAGAAVRGDAGAWPVQLNFTVGGLKPISEGHSFHYAGAHTNVCMAGAHTNRRKSPKIAENPSLRVSFLCQGW